MTTNNHIVSIGCGNMGAAILSGLVTRHPDTRITAIDPTPDRARSLLPSGAKIEIHPSLASAKVSKPDLTILAVKPQQFGTLAQEGSLGECVAGGLVVSIMAGVPVATISESLGTERVARAMPNLPAHVGAAMTTGYAPGTVDDQERDRIAAVFKSVGDFLWLQEEKQIDAATAVAGSGPGYVFAFAEHLERAAVAEGLNTTDVRRLVRATLLGAAKMLDHDPRSAQELKAAVTSKGGTTEAGLDILEAENALPKILTEAVRAAHRRSRDLCAKP